MGRFNIIIEGVDGTGKSMLATKLLLGLPDAQLRTSSEDKPESRQELLLALARAQGNASVGKINIFDRHPAISESCYQDQGGLSLGEVVLALEEDQIDMLIWASRPLDKLKIKVRDNDPRDVAYNKTLTARLPMIIDRYEALMTVLQNFMISRGKIFEVYTGWDNEFMHRMFMSKLELLVRRYSK